MIPQIFHVDAFTDTPFRGNSAGVVINADSLTEAQMQLIARELRHSETAFLLKPVHPGTDVHIRYFTPTTEVPICGHATIAAHYVRANVICSGNCSVRQSSAAGIHTIKRWMYLAVVLDLLSRKPVGWAMSFFPDSALTAKALSMAWEARGKPAGFLYHSDQGSHYASRNFRQLLWR